MPGVTESPKRRRAKLILWFEWVLFWTGLVFLIGTCFAMMLERTNEYKKQALVSRPDFSRMFQLQQQLITVACLGSVALLINLALNMLLRQALTRTLEKKMYAWICLRSGILIVDILSTIMLATLLFEDATGELAVTLCISWALYVYRAWSIYSIHEFFVELNHRGEDIPMNNLRSNL